MTVTVHDRTFHLHFMHSSPGADSDPDFEAREGATTERLTLDDDAKFSGRRLTVCTVSEVFEDSTDKEYVLLGQGLAQCHPKDSFNKAKGRKQSLQYALLAAWPSKDIDPELDNDALFDNYTWRDAVWQGYLVQSGIKKVA